MSDDGRNAVSSTGAAGQADEQQDLSYADDQIHHNGSRPPNISRKITACVACRKLKIKCHMPGSGSPPCTRCRRKTISCVVNRSLQTLLQDNESWQDTVTSKVTALEAFMGSASEQLMSLQAQLRRLNNDQRPNATPRGEPSQPWPGSPHQEVREIRMNIDSGPATIPASSVSEHNQDQRTPSRPRDLISDGLLTVEEAHHLFEVYAHRLDHYLYRILGSEATFKGTRTSSSVLFAAICTVGALHSSRLRHLYGRCYRRFQTLTADLALSKDANLDDIRGLCIGAFWLHEISWNLSSIAVRIATHQHLHRAFARQKDRRDDSYDQMRLYYLVYICDHHFSIAYGRPPMTREGDMITSVKAMLVDPPEATEDDARLASQVEIWSTVSQELDTLGTDVDPPVSPNLIPRIRRLLIALDTWRADWHEEFGHNPHVGNYPRKGVKLHYHFAKLYVCSHAFRGLAPGPSRERPGAASMDAHMQASPWKGSNSVYGNEESSLGRLDLDLEEIAAAAVDCAQSILHVITADTEIQAHLNGLPLYFDTMIAFAVAFLFKVATRYSHVVRIDIAGTLKLVRDMAQALKSATSGMHQQHLLVALAPAIEKLASAGDEEIVRDQSAHPTPATGMDDAGRPARLSAINEDTMYDGPDMVQDWAMAGFDWTNYDFLPQEGDFVQLTQNWMQDS